MKFERARPFLAIVFIQFLYAFMSIVAKSALNAGMSPRVLVAYRMAVASALITPFALVLERNKRPQMTWKTLVQIAILSLFEPVIEQNLYYSGMKLTTATFTSALCNALPAMTFIMAWIFKLESVKIKERHSQAKLMGTVVAIGGAMLMTLLKGNVIELPWTSSSSSFNKHSHAMSAPQQEDIGKGSIMLIASCFSWTCYIILQSKIMVAYQAELTLTSLMCIMGMLEAAVVALVWERKNMSVFKVQPDVKLLASLYGGLVSALAYYVIGWVSKQRGPVFVSAFNPFGMVIVAILSSVIFSEKMYLGRVIGAVVIVIGIYLVLWGKSKDRRGQLTPIDACPGTPMVIVDEQVIPTTVDNQVVVPNSGQLLIPNASPRSHESV